MAYDHLVTMLYAGFFQCTSLRELITGMQANATRLNHLGLKHTPRRSTLSDANKRRAAVFFSDLYHRLYEIHFGLPDSRPRQKADRLFIIDSTTIGLFSEIMKGAGSYKDNGRKKGGVKAHMMIDAQHDIPAFIFITPGKEHDLVFLQKLHVPDNSTLVMDKAYINYKQFKAWDSRGIKWTTRLKRDAFIQSRKTLPVLKEEKSQGVISDHFVVLGRPSNARTTPIINARIVCYRDAQSDRTFSFLTNDLQISPLQVAQIYRRRWQIEMLFKRIKQRYPLKYFLGDNPNAIKIQVWAALLCDLLVKIVQRKVNQVKKVAWAYASLASMIKHHLMTYLDLISFLKHPERALIKYKPPDFQLEIFSQGLASKT
jgi:hypothetical protein